MKFKESIHDYFSGDHERVESILNECTRDPHNLHYEAYIKFRIALLTHIKMEENVLFPAAKKANGGKPLPNFDRYRQEHAALTTLVAVHPTKELMKVIRHVLDKHDEAEEEPGGLYEVCQRLTVDQEKEILEKVQNMSPTPLHPPKKEEYVLEAAKRVLKRAGYDYDKIVKS